MKTDNKLQVIANSAWPVLIEGESGTGKTKLAHELHKISQRHRERFVRLNITSLNKNLFESEMFGHVKGAYSGALGDKEGFCESVGKGTFFIDEIGDLSIDLQAKLLTLIDEGLYFKVGCNKEKKFTGKLIFATNKNLSELVSKGKFREDLFYRLRCFKIEQTALRAKKDLYQIILHEIACAKVKMNKEELFFENNVINILESYSWPGNYRELKYTIQNLVEVSNYRVEKKDLPSWVLKKDIFKDRSTDTLDYYSELEQFEQNYFDKLLHKTEGSIVKSVEVSGVCKVTLISKLKKYDINRVLYKNLRKVDRANGF